MRKISNIRLKDEYNSRLLTIKRFRECFNVVGLKEAIAKVDELLNKGEMIAPYENDSCHRVYDLMSEYSMYHVDEDFKKVFDFDFENTDDIEYEKMYGPNEVTKEALSWYEGLSAEDKTRVDLLIDFKGRRILSAGGSAMMSSAFGG